ncbi:MAG: hypothetical protein AAB909_01540 [Patescibacteria group bacterium]
MTVLLQVFHALVLSRLEFFLYPELLIYPYLTASRVIPYAQILDQHFPGLMFFPINFFTLGFQDPVSFKSLMIIIVLIQSAIIYRLSRSKISVLLLTLWQPIFEGNQLWLETFLPLFLLPGFLLFQAGNFLTLGLVLGLAVVFKQTLIPVVAYVGMTLLFRRRFRQLFIFSIAAVFPSILMLLYFYRLGTLADFWYWTVDFNLTVFASLGRNLPTLKEAAKVMLIFSVGLYCFVRYPKSRHMLLWGLLASLETFSRFGLIHLQPFIPFLAVAVSLAKKSLKFVVLTILISVTWFGYFMYDTPNPGGYKYFDTHNLKLIDIVKKHTDPGQKIFLLGVQPHVYKETSTLPPANIFVFQFPWFLQVSGGRILTSLRVDPPELVLFDTESNIDDQYLRDYASYLVEYIKAHYQLIDQVDSVQIYARRN